MICCFSPVALFMASPRPQLGSSIGIRTVFVLHWRSSDGLRWTHKRTFDADFISSKWHFNRKHYSHGDAKSDVVLSNFLNTEDVFIYHLDEEHSHWCIWKSSGSIILENECSDAGCLGVAVFGGCDVVLSALWCFMDLLNGATISDDVQRWLLVMMDGDGEWK